MGMLGLSSHTAPPFENCLAAKAPTPTAPIVGFAIRITLENIVDGGNERRKSNGCKQNNDKDSPSEMKCLNNN
jgi:hypothetical protein